MRIHIIVAAAFVSAACLASVGPAGAVLLSNSLMYNTVTSNTLVGNILTSNTLVGNVLTTNALVGNALEATGSSLDGLNGVAVEAATAPGAPVAFNPQPDPPGFEDW
jgi:hypothetical protein